MYLDGVLLRPYMHGRTYGDLQMAQLVHIGLPLQASRDCLLQGLGAHARFASQDQMTIETNSRTRREKWEGRLAMDICRVVG